MAEQYKANKKRKKQKKLWLLLAAIFVAIALIAAVVLLKDKKAENAADEQYTEIASQVNAQSDASVPLTSQEPAKEYTLDEKIQLIEEKYGITVPEKNLDFEKMQAETNPDIYAWLYLPGTNIDYPVLQHPNDDEFYLMHNLDGSYGYPSCVYSEPSVNAKDFEDRMTVLYAHDLSGGRMFGDVKLFAQKDYFDANRYMFVYLPDDIKVYEIVSCSKHNDSHLLKAYHNEYDEVYLSFLENSLNTGEDGNALADYTFTAEDKALVLSTCIRPEPAMRRLLIGVLLDEAW